MGNRLRSPDEGADTVVWLCVANQAREQPNGSFFQGNKTILHWCIYRNVQMNEGAQKNPRLAWAWHGTLDDSSYGTEHCANNVNCW